MDYTKKLTDAIAALMVSYSIIAVMCYLSLNFLSTLYSAIILIAGLATALVLLFIGKDNKRNTRIASICCNSVAIGTMISMILKISEEMIDIKEIIFISAIFVGVVFSVYYIFSKFEKRLPPAISAGILIVTVMIIYSAALIEHVTTGIAIFVFLNFILTIIHYITALVVVKSSSKSIIDGMSYGYFGMTLVILVVLGIFLLVASDGDADGLDFIGDSNIRDSISNSASDIVDIASATVMPNSREKIVTETTLYYMIYLQSVLNDLTAAQLLEINELEKQYNEGAFTKAEYEKKLDKYK